MALDFRSMGMRELWRQDAELLRVGEVAVDVQARVLSHLDSFKDMAKYVLSWLVREHLSSNSAAA